MSDIHQDSTSFTIQSDGLNCESICIDNKNNGLDANASEIHLKPSMQSVETNQTSISQSSSNAEQPLDSGRNSSEIENAPTAATTSNQPPTYWDVPGTVPISAGTSTGPPPTYEEVMNPNVPPPSYQSLFGQVQNARKTAKTLPDLIKKLIIVALGTIGLTVLIAFTVLIPFTMILVGASNLDNCPAENIPLFLLIGGVAWIVKNILNFFSQCSTSSTQIPSITSSNTNNNSGNCATNACNVRCAPSSTNAESNATSDSCGSNNANSRNSNRIVINLENERDISHVINDYQTSKSNRRDFLINSFIFGWFLAGCVMVYRNYPPNYTNPSNANFCSKSVYLYAFWLLTSIFIMFGLFISCICCVSITALFSSNSEFRFSSSNF